MRLYSCKVRLSGSLYNEVLKDNVTAGEIHILKLLHGEDSVVSIADTGTAMSLTAEPGEKPGKRGQTEERARLEELYGQGLVAAQIAKLPTQTIATVFGIGAQLPEEVPGVAKAVPGKKPVAPAPAPEPEPDDEVEEPDAEE